MPTNRSVPTAREASIACRDPLPRLSAKTIAGRLHNKSRFVGAQSLKRLTIH